MLSKESREEIGLGLLTLADKYLGLVRNVLQENIKGGQCPVRSYDVSNNKSFDWEKYFEDTKWDYREIIIPILFNFYHGLELRMKGSLVLLSHYNISADHKLTGLLNDFRKNYKNQHKTIQFLEKYIDTNFMPEYLKSWFVKHNLQIDNYYHFLKYPFDKKFEKSYNYFELKYDLDSEAVNLSEAMVEDIRLFLQETRNIFHELSKSTKQEPYSPKQTKALQWAKR